MTTYNTRNPLGSAAVKDLYDNAENLDFAVNDITKAIWNDRLGRPRKTWYGMEVAFLAQLASQESRFNAFIERSGYQVIGDYEDGPLTITEYNQLVRYQSELWKITADTDIPFTTSGNNAESWEVSDKAHFVSVGDGALRQNLGSGDGLKLIGRCSFISLLNGIEPEYNGQVIDVVSRSPGWESSAFKSPWGGGRFLHLANATTDLYPHINGVIHWTAGGKCWIRESLVLPGGMGRIYAEWFSDVYSGLTQDWAKAFNDANKCAELMVNSLNPYFGRRVEIVCPKFFALKSSVVININAAWINGDNGSCCVYPDGDYKPHPQVNSSVSADSSAAVANFKYAFGLISSTVSTSSSNYSCYYNQSYVKDLSLSCSTPDSDIKLPYHEQTAQPSTYITALVHFGNPPQASESNINGTVQTAQGDIRNVSVNGFGCGYSNGDNAWGVDFYECKWTGNYYGQFLIAGNDNGERYNFFGNVWQNGGHCFWSHNWAGDVQFIGGSMVWNAGQYIHAAGYTTFDCQLSRVEHVTSKSEIVYMDDASMVSGIYPSYAKCIFRPTLVLVSRVSLTSDKYNWFRCGRYRELVVDTGAWSWNSYALSPNVKLCDDTALGKINFKGNPMRIGGWQQFKQVPNGGSNRMLSMRFLSDVYKLASGDASYKVEFSAANHNMIDSGDMTISCVTTTTSDFFADLLIPIDAGKIQSLRNIFPYLKASKNSFNKDLVIAFYYRSELAHQPANTSAFTEYKVAEFKLSSFVSDADIMMWGNSDGLAWPSVTMMADQLRLTPTQLRVNFYFPGTVGATAGQSITITDIGVAGF